MLNVKIYRERQSWFFGLIFDAYEDSVEVFYPNGAIKEYHTNLGEIGVRAIIYREFVKALLVRLGITQNPLP